MYKGSEALARRGSLKLKKGSPPHSKIEQGTLPIMNLGYAPRDRRFLSPLDAWDIYQNNKKEALEDVLLTSLGGLSG